MEQKIGNSNSRIIAIITMCFIFAMISFVTNMGAPFGNIWGFKYTWASMMGNMMNFAAYLFMGIPAGKMLESKGYKKTALIALAVGTIGLLIQYMSSLFGDDIVVFTLESGAVCLNLIIYLLGAFVCGFCVCMLNTVVNPMLNLLGGGGNRGNQLIQIGGTLNSLTGTLTPLLAGVLVGTVTAQTSMSDVAPLLFIGMAVFIIAFFIIYNVYIPEPQAKKDNATYERSPWAFRHFVLGVIGIFFYVGIEIGIPAQLNFYISNMDFTGAASVGGAFAAVYWLFTLNFSLSGDSEIASLLKLDDHGTGVVAFTIPTKCVLIALCGFCTSIMWGGIFNLAVEGLGKYTAQASGIFMMMVVGGGVMPLIQDGIAKAAGPIASYWLIIAMVAYLLFYALIGAKNVNKDIVVD